jgi:hypothetical protein
VKRHAGRGLAALGVHTPEFEHERDPDRVAAHARRLGLDFPQLLDPESAYWRALGNEYWPTVYLVDGCGRIRHEHVGEVHEGEPSARRLEAALEALLDERPGC